MKFLLVTSAMVLIKALISASFRFSVTVSACTGKATTSQMSSNDLILKAILIISSQRLRVCPAYLFIVKISVTQII